MIDFKILEVKAQMTPFGKKLLREMKELDKLEVRIGFQAGANSDDKGTDYAAIAAYNEYGTKHIPSRPFLRTVFERYGSKIDSVGRGLFNQLIMGAGNAQTVLQRIGVAIKGHVQENIVSGGWTANSPKTIALKGSAKPLIDSGIMRTAVNFWITSRGGK